MKTVWIGMARFEPLPGSDILGNASGAFANVIAWASNSSEFDEEVRKLAAYLEIRLVDIEDAEPVDNRESESVSHPDIATLIAEVRDDPEAVRYASFIHGKI